MGRNTPLISIVVPNYNHSEFLELRLKSIFSQKYQNFELIILDDCSTDSSRDIILEYQFHPKVSKIEINAENSGSPFKQWNKGIDLAQGKYIWIAESDDYCEKSFLERLIKCHQNNPEIALAFTQSYRVNSEGEIKGTWLDHTDNLNPSLFKEDFVLKGNYFIEKYLIHKNVIPNVSGVLFKKKALQSIFPLKIEPYLKYNADWFYYVQLLCNSKLAFIAEPLNYFRFHPKSVIANAGSSSGWLKIFKMELRARNEMLFYLKECRPSNINEMKKKGRIGNNQLYYLIAMEYLNSGNLFQAIRVIAANPFILKKIIIFTIKNN